MTWEIAIVLGILAASLVLFVTEKLPMDVVALLVLVVLAIGGFVTLEQALEGFSNPAVVTVWAMFILSAGLSATGVADIIGRHILRLAGRNEIRMILVIMLAAGGLSAFMNNIGVAALMLPVVMDIARRTQVPPARLLMPMAYGSLLGGLTTLIGTPPNLVASSALHQAGFEPFRLFDFAPIGVPALVVGALFVALVGRHLLPSSMPESMVDAERTAGSKLRFSHDLETRRFRLRIAKESPLGGMSLSDSGLSALFGFQVLSIERGGHTHAAPAADFILTEGDILSVQGREESVQSFLQWHAFEVATGSEIAQLLSLGKVGLMSLKVASGSDLAGLSVQQADFRNRFEVPILAIRKPKGIIHENIATTVLEAGDVLTVEGKLDALDKVASSSSFSDATMISEESVSDIYRDSDSLLELDIPEQSTLTGLTIASSGLADALKIRVVGIARRSGSVYFPSSRETFQPGDKLLVHGNRDTLKLLEAFQTLELINGDEALLTVPTDSGHAEVTLSPGSDLVGKTLKDVDFRKRYGLQVLSIWRGGRAYRSYLRNMHLEFGDALLLFGPRERMEALARDEDFLILTGAAYSPAKSKKPLSALIAAGVMVAVILPVLLGWLPIAIAGIAGAVAMVSFRCLPMEQAYRAIEWKSVFLIAGMIPLGTAMQTSGAAQWIAGGVAAATAPLGVWGLIVGLYLTTALATTIVPTTALVLIMAPIAIQTATPAGIPPEMIMMAIAMAASASFTSPISHPANVLVMGPGGYRFVDYIKMGAPLALIVMITVLIMLAIRY